MVRGRAEHALLLLMIASLLLLAACDASANQSHANPTATPSANSRPRGIGSSVPTVTPPASLASRPLPAFSDPRVAYIGPDALLHVVSLDGRTNVTGTPIPLTGFPGDGLWAAGTSPDDKSLAYYEDAQITTIDATSGVLRTTHISEVGDSGIGWSPDQRFLVLQNGALICVNVATGSSFTTPGDPVTLAANSPWRIIGSTGWLDATHAAVTVVPNPVGTPQSFIVPTPVPGSPETYATLESLNITTNQLRPIARVQKGGSIGAFVALPGGRWSLFMNGQNQNQSYTPQVDLINNMTGGVTLLHHLTSLLPPRGFRSIVWRPNSTQAIVDTGFPQTGDDHYLLIDMLRDTATSVALPGFPEAWSPDGSTLVVATGSRASNLDGIGWQNVGEVGAGPFTLMAVRIGADGAMSSPVTLTTQAMNIPTLGFVHTA